MLVCQCKPKQSQKQFGCFAKISSHQNSLFICIYMHKYDSTGKDNLNTFHVVVPPVFKLLRRSSHGGQAKSFRLTAKYKNK